MVRFVLMHLACIAIGAFVGFLVWKFIGCRTGACPVTSNAWSSVLLGALIAWIVLSPLVGRFASPQIHKNVEKGDTRSE
jgi:hypothetical protein